MKLLKLINPEDVSDEAVKSYSTREAVRAVVFDKENNIALLYVSRDNYYKLPGGGLEQGEDYLTALRRECVEEIGCDIHVIDEIGEVTEYRQFCNLKQTSYCYLANLEGEKGVPNLMPDEIEDGFQLVWVPLKEALIRLSKNFGATLESRSYIVPRDITFLETVADLNKL
ncbi:NUDIX domain-containing protein [Candidatus Woesebacteria bacterium]|nr:NUDIX domain-containing protein [Candidatus Woesebacteria bacterium]